MKYKEKPKSAADNQVIIFAPEKLFGYKAREKKQNNHVFARNWRCSNYTSWPKAGYQLSFRLIIGPRWTWARTSYTLKWSDEWLRKDIRAKYIFSILLTLSFLHFMCSLFTHFSIGASVLPCTKDSIHGLLLFAGLVSPPPNNYLETNRKSRFTCFLT